MTSAAVRYSRGTMANSRPTDPLEILRVARDTARKMQELAGKLTLPPEQAKALADNMTRLVMPGEQLQALIDLADTFGPPQAQIEEIRSTIVAQRTQVEGMLEDLDRIEKMVERLALAAEQIAAAQAPFTSMLQRLDARTGGHPADDEDAD